MNKMCLILIVAGFAMSALFYPYLPDPMPTHWGIDGVADRHTPLPWGAFVMPVIALLTYAILRILPAISPKGFRMDGFLGAYRKVMLAVVAFLILLHGAFLWGVVRGDLNIATWLPVGLGVLFTIVGNYLNKSEPNFFFGIRTPWTLADPEVWARTHRIGGWAFMIAGACSIIAGLTLSQPYSVGVSVSAAMAAAVAAVLYSFVLYRKLNA